MGWGKRARAALKALTTRSGDVTEFDTWFAEALGNNPSATGLSVTQSTALNVSTFYAGVTQRAKDLARCAPRIVGVDRTKQAQARADRHVLSRLFLAPNPLQTWFEWMMQMHAAYLMRGNAYAVIVRDGHGQPVALWPINPDAVHIYEGPDGMLFYSVMRSGLYLRCQLQSLPLMVPDYDVLHLRGLAINSIYGVSTISVARDSIGLGLGLEQQAARFMGNGARPSGVLQTDKKLTDDAAKRLREQWEKMRAGIHNSGRTAVLEEGLKWQPMQLNSVDLEFIAQRRFQVEDIARFLGMPLHRLGVSQEAPVRIDQADQAYVNATVMPDCEMWEQKFGQRFDLAREGLRVDFDERQLLRAEEATRINNHRLAVMSGLRTPNEARAMEGDPPLPGGDRLMFPVNLGALGSDFTGTAPDGAGRPEEGTLPDPGTGGMRALLPPPRKAVRRS